MSNELIIKIEANQTNEMVVSELYLYGSNITVDWGDSTIEDYSEYIEHEYSEEGEYTITITGVSGIQDGLLMSLHNVVEVIIPNNITSLPNKVFRYCRNLERVVLPNGISSIGSEFCRGCTNLVELNLPNGISSIGNYFCLDCVNLVKLNLPDGLEDIGVYFLAGCGLDEVIFPYGLSVINRFALEDSNVSNIVIPKSVTSIGAHVFKNCTNLSYIEIPDSVDSIGVNFLDGSPLTTIKFYSETPPTIESIFLNGNDNCSIYVPEGSRDAYLNASNYPNDSARYVEYPTLKHKLETLGKLMASNLTKQFVSASWDEGLTTLANKVSDIQDFNDIFEFDSSNNYASNGFRMTWSSLIENNVSYFTLKIPSTITTLGDDSFYRFSSMRICEIPSSVTSIGNNVFSSTNKLKKIIFKGTTPPTATSSSFITNESQTHFNIPTTCVIEVPCSALSAYKSATNYPDPTVYTYQCIRFDEKCDSSNGLSNFESPIILRSYSYGVSKINYNSNMNAYALSGYLDNTVFPITQLDGQENFMMSCEINISNFGGESIGLAIIPPETGEETTSNKYGIMVHINAPSNNQITLQCMSAKSGGTIHYGAEDLTINIENLDWIKLCFMSDTTSSGSIIGQVEKLDGTILGTQTFTRHYSSSYYPQISNRKCGIYFLGNNEDDTVNIYIRNIKCIGY